MLIKKERRVVKVKAYSLLVEVVGMLRRALHHRKLRCGTSLVVILFSLG